MQDFKYGFYRWARKEAKKVISNEVRAGWGGYSQDLVSLGNFFVSVETTCAGERKLAGRQNSRFIFYSWRSLALFLLYWSIPGLQFPGL